MLNSRKLKLRPRTEWSRTNFPCNLSNWDERYQKEPHNGTRGYSFHETNGTSLLVIFERPHQTKGVSSFLRSKHIMYLLLGFLSLLFISAIILIGNLNPKEPPPAHPPTPLSPSATSGIMLALGPLLTCWGISIKIRCPRSFCAPLFTYDYRAIPVLDTYCPSKVRLRHGAPGCHNVLLVLLLHSDAHIARALPHLRVAHRRSSPSCPTHFDDSGS